MSQFEVKDSGERQQFDGGMVRDVEEGKIDYTLILDGPMLDRWADHLTKGAKKYAARNWMKAAGAVELERFKRSALRHFIQWFRNTSDEDHAAAVMFNINGAEYVKGLKVSEAKPVFLTGMTTGQGSQARVLTASESEEEWLKRQAAWAHGFNASKTP